MKTLTVGRRIALGFSVVVALAMVLGTLAYLSMDRASRAANVLAEADVPLAASASHLQDFSARAALAARGFGYTGDPKLLEEARSGLSRLRAALEQAESLVASRPELAKFSRQIDEVRVDVQNWSKSIDATEVALEAQNRAHTAAQTQAEAAVSEANDFVNAMLAGLAEEIAAGAPAGKLTERAKKIELATRLRAAAEALARSVARARTGHAEKALADVANEINRASRLLDELGEITRAATNRQQLDEARRAVVAAGKAVEALGTARAQLAGVTAERHAVRERILGELHELGRTASSASVQEARESSHELHQSTQVMATGVGITLLCTLGIAFFITRGVNRSVLGIVRSLADGSEQVAAAAAQVSGSAQVLAEGSSEQAGSLEKTSSSLEEMSAMTRRNADSAAQAKEIAARTRAAADAGTTDMAQMRRAMDDIKTSSREIAKIVKTIDEIAFQTNLLALNAAVEAARAGEAGAGFAVVAEEVRNLAQRSAQAAKETAARIEDSVTKSEHGVRISAKVAESLQDILTRAREVDTLIAEIATASEEQTGGVGQINLAVVEMDKITKSTAATAEESAAAAEELNAQSAELLRQVEQLRALVGDRARAAEAAEPAPRPEPGAGETGAGGSAWSLQSPPASQEPVLAHA